MSRQIQLSLFENDILKFDSLISQESPRKAFYKLWLTCRRGKYTVRKESGAGELLLDVREWPFTSFKDAKKYYLKKLKQKTESKERKRSYQNVH